MTTAGDAWTQKRSEIVQTAALLFDRHGYAQTSVDTIAAACGLHKPSLYHYCKSKSDILVQIHNDFMDLLCQRLDQARDSGDPADAQLRAVAGSIVGLMHTHRPYVRAFFEHYRELPAADRGEIARRRRAYEDAVRAMIEQAVAEGTFSPEIDPHYATMVLFGTVNWAYQWYGRRSDEKPQDVAEGLWNVLMSGFRREQPR